MFTKAKKYLNVDCNLSRDDIQAQKNLTRYQGLRGEDGQVQLMILIGTSECFVNTSQSQLDGGLITFGYTW